MSTFDLLFQNKIKLKLYLDDDNKVDVAYELAYLESASDAGNKEQ